MEFRPPRRFLLSKVIKRKHVVTTSVRKTAGDLSPNALRYIDMSEHVTQYGYTEVCHLMTQPRNVFRNECPVGFFYVEVFPLIVLPIKVSLIIAGHFDVAIPAKSVERIAFTRFEKMRGKEV